MRQPLATRPGAQSAAHSRNLAELAVALLTGIGIRTVVVLATERLITCGLRVSRPANVSPKLMACRETGRQAGRHREREREREREILSQAEQ